MIDLREIAKRFNLPRLLVGKTPTLNDLERFYEADIQDSLYDEGDLCSAERHVVWFFAKAIRDWCIEKGIGYSDHTRVDGTIDMRIYLSPGPCEPGEAIMFIRVFLRNFQYSVRGAEDKSVKTVTTGTPILEELDRLISTPVFCGTIEQW